MATCERHLFQKTPFSDTEMGLRGSAERTKKPRISEREQAPLVEGSASHHQGSASIFFIVPTRILQKFVGEISFSFCKQIQVGKFGRTLSRNSWVCREKGPSISGEFRSIFARHFRTEKVFFLFLDASFLLTVEFFYLRSVFFTYGGQTVSREDQTQFPDNGNRKQKTNSISGQGEP